MATSKLVRDDVIRIDGNPFRRLLVYRIEVSPIEAPIDLLLTNADYNIVSVVATSVTAFRQNASFELTDATDGETAGIIAVRAGHAGHCPIQVPSNPAKLDGPSRLRFTLAKGIPSVGMLSFDIGISGPLDAGDPSEGIIPLPPVGTPLPPPPPPVPPPPPPIPGTTGIPDQIALLTTEFASLRNAILAKADSYAVQQQLTSLIGNAPANAQSLGLLYGLIQNVQQSGSSGTAQAIANLIGSAPANAQTLGQLYSLIQSDQQAIAGIIGDAPVEYRSLGDLVRLIQTSQQTDETDDSLAIQQAIASLVGTAPSAIRTLGDLYQLIQDVQLSSTQALSRSISSLVGDAPANAQTFGQIYRLIQSDEATDEAAITAAVQQAAASLIGDAPAEVSSLGLLYQLIQQVKQSNEVAVATVAQQVTSLIGDAPPGANTLGQLYSLIGTVVRDDETTDASSLSIAVSGLIGNAPPEAQTLGQLYQLLMSGTFHGAGGSSQAIYTFPQAALQWVIVHNKKTLDFSATAKDDNNIEQFAAFVALDSNRIQVDFTEPVAGKALVTFY
jgi:hypothetical protein